MIISYFNIYLTWFLLSIVPISRATALEDYESVDKTYLSFKKGDKLMIFSKDVGTDDSIWQGSLV